MILYFTGTGNSKFAAEYIVEKTGEAPVSLFDYIRDDKGGDFSSEETYVFAAPTHAWRIPRKMEEIIRKSVFTKGKDAYFVLTCGDSIGNAGSYAKKLCDDIGLSYKGIFKIVMPENYIAMFNAPKKEEAIKIVKAAIPDLDEAAEFIKAGKDHFVKENIIGKLESGMINSVFYSFCIKDKAFTVSEECISCGLCERQCPVRNIKIADGKPQWQGNCIHCMSCICGCPKEAIEYGKKSIGQPRYKCPTADETVLIVQSV